MQKRSLIEIDSITANPIKFQDVLGSTAYLYPRHAQNPAVDVGGCREVVHSDRHLG